MLGAYRLRPSFRGATWALLALGTSISCGYDASNDDASNRGASSGGSNSASGGAANIGNGQSSGGSGSLPPLPPEKEKESSFKLPVRSGRWVWAANPLSDRVSAIDTRSLTVRLAIAGFGPTYLAPLHARGDADSAAIVLNAKSHDASVMRVGASGIDVKTVPTHQGANSWAVSPSGNWAIAWSDASSVTSPDPADSFQDVTLIDVSAAVPQATRLSVGYRPSRIFFDSTEARAFVVSESSLSVIALDHAGPNVERDVALGVGREKPVDVAVVPDGSYALFRVEGSSRVSFVEIETGLRSDVTLSGPITDLDLVANGTSAIAVVRGRPRGANSGTGGASGNGGTTSAGGLGANNGGAGTGQEAGAANGGESAGGSDSAAAGGASGGEATGNGEADAGAGGVAGAAGQGTPPASGFGPSEVAVLRLTDVIADPTRFASVEVSDLVGSVAVSNDGVEAVLYTTATDLDRVNVMATDPAGAAFLVPRPVYVHAPVDAVFIAPDHAHALVTLRAAQGSTGVGFGIVPLVDALPAQVRATNSAITSAAFAEAPTTSAILTAANGLTAYLVRMPELRVDAVPLLNLPLAAGIVPEEGVGYVVQKHPDGQLSLIDLDSADLRTLTGFELSRGVSDGQ